MQTVGARLMVEIGKTYTLTLASRETVKVVFKEAHWTPNGDIFEIEVNGVLKIGFSLNDVIGDFLL